MCGAGWRNSVYDTGFIAVTKEVTSTTTTRNRYEGLTLMTFETIKQSDPYNNNQFPSGNALDSNGSTFSCTNHGVGQYWMGWFTNGYHLITTVRIRNRGDCCGERLAGTKIKIGNELCGMVGENT